MNYSLKNIFVLFLHDYNICIAAIPVNIFFGNFAKGVFHDSTIRALEYYSGAHPAFPQTAKFLKVVGNAWKILNVKSPFQDRLILT